ncbi:acyl carrier protein [Kitasatospora sp. NPDC001660]
MPEVLPVIVEELSRIRPELVESHPVITRESVLFYAADPDQPALELDSMEALELLFALEKEFGIELAATSTRTSDLQTIGDVVDAVSAAL